MSDCTCCLSALLCCPECRSHGFWVIGRISMYSGYHTHTGWDRPNKEGHILMTTIPCFSTHSPCINIRVPLRSQLWLDHYTVDLFLWCWSLFYPPMVWEIVAVYMGYHCLAVFGGWDHPVCGMVLVRPWEQTALWTYRATDGGTGQLSVPSLTLLYRKRLSI